MRRFLLASIVLLAAFPALASEPRDLDSALKEQAGKILDYAREHRAKNLAVLKFLVRTGDGPFSDSVGPLNNNLADRLTVALVMALPDEEIGVVANADQVLEKSKANHLDEDGRAACFRGRGFVLAWGDPEIPVRPDLFITGTATLSKDLKQTTVKFQAFGKDCKLDESLGEFTVPTSTRTLIDTGNSYLLTPKSHPKLFARGIPKDEQDDVATDVSKKYNADLSKDPLPSFEQEAPVRVTVYYGDDAVPVKDGAVPEPKEKQKVWFKLENMTDDVYGVVLKVNGENTLFREKFADRDCTKWLLAPKGKQIGNLRDTVIVRGYQMNDNQRADFEVKSPEASKAGEVRYGPFSGTFQITAFHGKGDKAPEPPPPPPVLKDEQQVVAAISRGTLKIGSIQPGDLKALQAELRQREKKAENGRGMIDGDTTNPKPHAVEKVPFVPDPPIPVMSYRIRYYQAANGK
jgi:hypothetical protein